MFEEYCNITITLVVDACREPLKYAMYMGEKNAEGKLLEANNLIKVPKKATERW